MRQDRRNPPPSPCTDVCVVDRAAGMCVGCMRTLDEIEAWEDMSPEEQWAVVDEIEMRRAAWEADGA